MDRIKLAGGEAAAFKAAERCQVQIRRETEMFLRGITIDGYAERSAGFWRRDYSSVEKYLASVAGARQAWLECLGDFSPFLSPSFNPESEPVHEDDGREISFLSIEHGPGWRTWALHGRPRGRSSPCPLVIAQHGIGSSPFHLFGFIEPEGGYHSLGLSLVDEGWEVLAPFNITEAVPRARIQMACLLLGKSLPGLEVGKYGRWLDYFFSLGTIDPERVAMWGQSLGGYYTLLTMPVEERIRAGVCSSFFNGRLEKMIVDDRRYSSFISAGEDHISIPGWLTVFSDHDLVSLICPRPFMVQAGRQDGVSWPPFVEEEFRLAAGHYRKLGREQDIALDLHSGGHEVRVAEGVAFLHDAFERNRPSGGRVRSGPGKGRAG